MLGRGSPVRGPWSGVGLASGKQASMGLRGNRLRDGDLVWGLKVKVSGPMGTGHVECKKAPRNRKVAVG